MSGSLTPKQEKFCCEYLKCGNASEAYRIAYSADNCKPESVHRLAKALLDNVKVASRIKGLREPVVVAAQLSLESHLATLAELRDKALQSEKFDSAVKAEELRGKASGFYIERKEKGPPGSFDVSEADLDREIIEKNVKLGYVKAQKKA